MTLQAFDTFADPLPARRAPIRPPARGRSSDLARTNRPYVLSRRRARRPRPRQPQEVGFHLFPPLTKPHRSPCCRRRIATRGGRGGRRLLFTRAMRRQDMARVPADLGRGARRRGLDRGSLWRITVTQFEPDHQALRLVAEVASIRRISNVGWGAAIDEDTRAHLLRLHRPTPAAMSPDPLRAVVPTWAGRGRPCRADRRTTPSGHALTSARPLDFGATAGGAITTTIVPSPATAPVTGGACGSISGNFDWSVLRQVPVAQRTRARPYSRAQFPRNLRPRLPSPFHGIAIGLRDRGMTATPAGGRITTAYGDRRRCRSGWRQSEDAVKIRHLAGRTIRASSLVT